MTAPTTTTTTTNLIVVTGLTGKQGGSVASTFLSTPGWRVRGITRDPTSSSAQAWRARGVDVVRADLDDVTSLTAAFAGAAAIFGITDFWTPMADPANHEKAARQGISINEWCYELEVRRGRNLAVAASRTAGLRRYVFSSMSEARRWSGGKYARNLHFDSKGAVGRWIREERPPELGGGGGGTGGDWEGGLSAVTSFLQVGYYMDNWKFVKGDIKKAAGGDGDDGGGGGYYHPGILEPGYKVPFVWTQRDVGVLVRALVEAEPGKNLLGYSELLTWEEFMGIWSRVLGAELAGDGWSGVKVVSVGEFKDTIEGPEELKLEVLESYQYVQEFGWTGGEPGVIYPHDVGADKYTSRAEDYISQEDWTPLLGERNK